MSTTLSLNNAFASSLATSFSKYLTTLPTDMTIEQLIQRISGETRELTQDVVIRTPPKDTSTTQEITTTPPKGNQQAPEPEKKSRKKRTPSAFQLFMKKWRKGGKARLIEFMDSHTNVDPTVAVALMIEVFDGSSWEYSEDACERADARIKELKRSGFEDYCSDHELVADDYEGGPVVGRKLMPFVTKLGGKCFAKLSDKSRFVTEAENLKSEILSDD